MVYISLYSGDIFQGWGPFTLPSETENNINFCLKSFASELETDTVFITKKKKGDIYFSASTYKKKHTVEYHAL